MPLGFSGLLGASQSDPREDAEIGSRAGMPEPDRVSGPRTGPLWGPRRKPATANPGHSRPSKGLS